jgi:hypothetical protein
VQAFQDRNLKSLRLIFIRRNKEFSVQSVDRSIKVEKLLMLRKILYQFCSKSKRLQLEDTQELQLKIHIQKLQNLNINNIVKVRKSRKAKANILPNCKKAP